MIGAIFANIVWIDAKLKNVENLFGLTQFFLAEFFFDLQLPKSKEYIFIFVEMLF